MADLKVAVPITFALAVSAAAPNAGNAALGDNPELLKPGSLRNLLAPGAVTGGGTVAPRAGQELKQQIAQCWMGYWRRC